MVLCQVHFEWVVIGAWAEQDLDTEPVGALKGLCLGFVHPGIVMGRWSGSEHVKQIRGSRGRHLMLMPLAT